MNLEILPGTGPFRLRTRAHAVKHREQWTQENYGVLVTLLLGVTARRALREPLSQQRSRQMLPPASLAGVPGLPEKDQELEAAIREFVAAHNQQPRPFRWTKSADQILASIVRFATATLAAHAPASYTRNQ